MKDENLEQRGYIRTALVGNILGHLDRGRMGAALAVQSRYARQDAICGIIRDAVIASPVVMFSGEPHTYVDACGYYRRFTWNDMMDSIYVVMREAGVRDGDYGKVPQFCRVAMAAVSNREYSIDTSVVVMRNGVYSTFDNSLHPFGGSFMTNACVDYDYIPGERSFLWQRFLDRVLPDREHQALLQEFVASCYVLRSRVKLEHMLILLGNGQNGKSVIFEVVSALLGEDSVTHFYLSDLIGGQRREQNIANCKGKRLNYCSEIRTKEINSLNSDAIKTLISSEPVMGRKLFMEPEKINSFPLLMANANVLPRIEDPSDSLKRRFLIIPFHVTIPKEEQDLELASSLKEQLSGIFNWAMEGLARLKSNDYKITVPDSVGAVVESYFSENNIVVRWTNSQNMFARMNHNTDPNSVWQLSRAMYANFCIWCDDEGEEHISHNRFVQELKGAGFIQHRNATGSGFIYYVAASPERIRARNLDLAVEMEDEDGGLNVRTYIGSGGEKKVVGVNEAEQHLGLPKDTLWGYLSAGRLDGTYRQSKDGPIFDVRKLLMALAEANYFETMKNDGVKGLKKSAGHALKGFRRIFNEEMRDRGLPFRKYKSELNVIPARAVGCILVPDDWVYTRDNAEKAIQEYNCNNRY